MKHRVTDFSNNPGYIKYAESILGVTFAYDHQARAIASIEFDDCKNEVEVLAVVVLSRWSPTNVELSIASTNRRWATRKFIYDVFSHLFCDCNRVRVTFVVEQSNQRSIDLQIRLGHKKEGILEDCFGEGKDGVIFGLTRRNWRVGRFADKYPHRTTRIAGQQQEWQKEAKAIQKQPRRQLHKETSI